MDRRQQKALSQLADALQEMCDSGLNETQELSEALGDGNYPPAVLPEIYEAVILLSERRRQPMLTHIQLGVAINHGLTLEEMEELEAKGQLITVLWEKLKEQGDSYMRCHSDRHLFFSSLEHEPTGEDPDPRDIASDDSPCELPEEEDNFSQLEQFLLQLIGQDLGTSGPLTDSSKRSRWLYQQLRNTSLSAATATLYQVQRTLAGLSKAGLIDYDCGWWRLTEKGRDAIS